MAYCTVDEIKQDLGIITTEYDTFLSAYIDHATALINTYIGRDLESKEHTEKFIIEMSEFPDMIVLTHRPVTNVSSVKLDDESLDSDEFEVRLSMGIILLKNYTLGAEVEVVYTAGYSTIPDDINYICRNLVIHMFNNRDGVVVSQERSGSWSVTLAGTEINSSLNRLLESYSNILDRYRNVAI